MRPAIPFLVAAIGIANFVCMDAVMKGQSIAIGAYAALLWRAVFGVPAAIALFLVARRRWPPRARVRLHLVRAGTATISVLLFFWGLARTPMAEAVALTFLAPLIAILLAAVLLGERVRRGALLGAGLALAGVVLIVAAKRGGGAGDGDLWGAGAILIASALYGYNLVLLRQQAQAADPIEITLFSNLIMLVLLGVGAPWAGVWPQPSGWTMLPLAAGLAIISSLLLAWAYARAEAQNLAITEYTAFVWAALLGWLIYDERLTAATVAGAALIVAGCVVATRRARVAATVRTEAAL